MKSNRESSHHRSCRGEWSHSKAFLSMKTLMKRTMIGEISVICLTEFKSINFTFSIESMSSTRMKNLTQKFASGFVERTFWSIRTYQGKMMFGASIALQETSLTLKDGDLTTI